ncbi:MAG: hypothetical protein K9J06_10710 [Flavobacteriales bacterium]|nr:hypothetical protein [Flavobacteriales bacterium]
MIAKWFKHGLMYVAGAIIVMHSVLPHAHVSELPAVEHTEIHADADGVMGWIQLLLHDREQLAHTFVTRVVASAFAVLAFIALVPLVALYVHIIRTDDVVNLSPLAVDDFRLVQLGHVITWGVRPPPVA